jgi:hypothetical protein
MEMALSHRASSTSSPSGIASRGGSTRGVQSLIF